MRKAALILLGFFILPVVVAPAVAATDSAPTVKHVVTSPAGSQATAAGDMGTDQPQAPSEYIMPYPGMLPDNPLYFLKQLRDTIMELLITDPAKKAEFYVLRSDKFLGMTTMLIEKGKNDLAASMLAASTAEMRKTVSGLTDLKSNGVTVPSELTGKVKQSIAKHMEVLDQMTGGISNAAVSEAKTELTKLQDKAAAL